MSRRNDLKTLSEMSEYEIYALNRKIRKKAQKSFNLQIVKSFAGKSLDEICSWYPFMITKEDVFAYAIQIRQYELLADFAAYESNPTISQDDVKATMGLINFVTLVNELAQRVCFMMFQLMDNWEFNKNREYFLSKNQRKELDAKYSRYDFNEYVQQMGGGKHFITKSEFEQFIKDVKDKVFFKSLNELNFSMDSLFLVFLQHGREYGLTMKSILNEIIPKGSGQYQHEGFANEFIHVWNVMKDEYKPGSRLFNRENLFYDFFLWEDTHQDINV